MGSLRERENELRSNGGLDEVKKTSSSVVAKAEKSLPNCISESVIWDRGDGLVGVVSFVQARLWRGELCEKFDEDAEGWLYRRLLACGRLPP